MSLIVARSASAGGSTSPGGNLVLVAENPVTPGLPAAIGANSIVLGELAETSASAPNSLAIGKHSLARHPGAVVTANGRFQSSGDAQTGKYLLRTHTVNNAQTEAFLDGTSGTQRLVLPDDCTWSFKLTATAHRTDAGDGHAGYIIHGVIYRGAGVSSISFQGTPTRQVLAESDSDWDINIEADHTYGSLSVLVSGETGKTIRWLIQIETVEVTN